MSFRRLIHHHELDPDDGFAIIAAERESRGKRSGTAVYGHPIASQKTDCTFTYPLRLLVVDGQVVGLCYQHQEFNGFDTGLVTDDVRFVSTIAVLA